MTFFRRHRKWLLLSVLGLLVVSGGAASTLTCGPFSDVSGGQCAFILQLYYLGIAGGTSATTFDPTANVTRGQVAVFMGAAMGWIKRTENPLRVANKANVYMFDFDYDNYASANTSFPNGFCTDGVFNYVANQNNNKIDVYQNYGNHTAFSSFTTATANNRLACNATWIWATSLDGNSVKRINLKTGAVTDPWVAGPAGGAGDIINLGYELVVTTSTGLYMFDHSGGNTHTATFGSGVYGVVADQNNFLYANTGSTLYKTTNTGGILASTPLSGTGNFYPVFDGAAVWVPVSNGIDIFATNMNLIDHRPLTDGGATAVAVVGGGFDGRHVIYGFYGDLGCGGNNGTVVISYEAGTHAPIQGIGEICGDGLPYTIGWDGSHLHALTWANTGKHYVW